LNLRDTFNKVFVSELSTTSAESSHASLNANSFHLGSIEVRSTSSKFFVVYIVFVDIHFSRVNLHDTSTGLFIRMRKLNLTIKTSRTEKGGIQSVWSVGCCNDLNIVVLRETIELVKKLKHSAMHFTSFTFST